MTSVHPNLDPEKIFERGFITKEEAEVVELSSFGSKINLADIEGEIEGIWVAFLTEEDKKRYNNDGSSGEDIRCILLNHAFCFYPSPTWGRVLTGKTNGSQRPVFKAADQIDHFKATHEAYINEYPRKEESGAEADNG